jgi:sterol desaturase/sphingolipid hydroxylase (fatty acid hydroxylase superfamily)
MMIGLLLPLFAFWFCLAGVVLRAEGRARMRARTAGEWTLDLVNLGVQGWAVPLGAAWLGRSVWAPLVPAGALPLGGVGGFLAALFAVDLLYYANHRLLHVLWPVHRVHHSAPAMDVWVTARNTAWTTAILVYPWAGSFFLHALDVPDGYLLGAALTAALDLWRHSPLDPPRRVAAVLARVGLVLPRHHAWHHSATRHDVNFGANWSWWDRLFGTWHDPGHAPATIGAPTGLSTWRALLWPFGGPR